MKKIVVNGTFDVLHPGHVFLLNAARAHGDYLLVCIDADQRVSALKGSDRPILTQDERRVILLNLKSVDEVQIFNSEEELVSILSAYQPDVMVKGSDWKGRPIVGEHCCKRIEFYDRIEQYSTTKTIQRITGR